MLRVVKTQGKILNTVCLILLLTSVFFPVKVKDFFTKNIRIIRFLEDFVISSIFLESKNQKSGTQPEIFQGMGGFAELGHFNKYFTKNTIIKGPAGKHYLLDTIKITF